MNPTNTDAEQALYSILDVAQQCDALASSLKGIENEHIVDAFEKIHKRLKHSFGILNHVYRDHPGRNERGADALLG